jgi:D-alanyl-D-alanine dipeptidase
MKLLAATLGTLLFACGTLHAATPVPAGSRQLLLVTTNSWDAVPGTLQRFERTASGSAWTPVGEAHAVVVGRNGLGWGLGLHSTLGFLAEPGQPIKQEGDGKAPAGVFALATAFGADASLPRAEAATENYPYTQATDDFRCVDDVNSPYYNELVNIADLGLAPGEPLPWSSDERMLRTGDGLYRVGVVVKHNMMPATMGMGSCIFMHIWRGADRGTAGCTAMEEPLMFSTALWLNENALPTLVQLPQEQYELLKSTWELP